MQLILIALAFCFFVFVKSVAMDKPSKIILGVFIGYWLFAMYVPTTGYGGYYYPGFYTYFLLILNLVFFTLGFSIRKITKANPSMPEMISNALERISKNKVTWIVATLSCLYIVSKLTVYSASIAIYASVGDMRTAFFEGTLYGSEFPYVNLFLQELFFFFIPLFCYLTFKKRRLLWLITGVFIFGYIVLKYAF